MKQKIALLILVLVGVLVMSLALISVLKSVKLTKHGIPAEGTVLITKRISRTKGSSTYDITVSFKTSDGSETTATANKRSTILEGQNIKFWYDPANPQKIDFGDSIGYNMRGVYFGAFFILIGVYLLFRIIIRDSANNKLIRSGRKISAEFVSVDRNEKYKMGDKNPWVIKCKWTDNNTNKEYYFLSGNYVDNPSPNLNGRTHFDIFIDPADPTRYYIDTSFIPEGNVTMM